MDLWIYTGSGSPIPEVSILIVIKIQIKCGIIKNNICQCSVYYRKDMFSIRLIWTLISKYWS